MLSFAPPLPSFLNFNDFYYEHTYCEVPCNWVNVLQKLPLLLSDRICKAKTPFVSGIRLKLSFVPSVNTVQNGGQTESLWGCNYKRRGLELSAELCTEERQQVFSGEEPYQTVETIALKMGGVNSSWTYALSRTQLSLLYSMDWRSHCTAWKSRCATRSYSVSILHIHPTAWQRCAILITLLLCVCVCVTWLSFDRW